jgi:hypothetical protein
MRAVAAMTMLLALAGPAMGQGLSLPGLGGAPTPQASGTPGLPWLGGAETPEQKRAFCQRVAGAALRCGPTLDIASLSACLMRSLPPQDSMRVAQVANSARGGASALLSECGVGFGR